jgi:hypothetical protein
MRVISLWQWDEDAPPRYRLIRQSALDRFLLERCVNDVLEMPKPSTLLIKAMNFLVSRPLYKLVYLSVSEGKVRRCPPERARHDAKP